MYLKVFILGLLLFLGSFLILPSQLVSKPSAYIVVDFAKPSTEKRFNIYQNNRLVLSTWVAHGINSGKGVYATQFSNKPGSYMSSLGRYRIIGIYKGKHGVSYQLQGLDSTNSNVKVREIVIHSANYIGYGRTGHSEGCFALPVEDYKAVQQYLFVGEIIYAIR